MSETVLLMADRFCRAFLRPGDRAQATHALAAYGCTAIPVLQAILSGEAKNEFGVAYRRLGMPVDGALVTIQLLGPTARPLAPFVRAELRAGHAYAEDAWRAIMSAPASAP